jgi:DNA-binding FadR family transcriptional regulator
MVENLPGDYWARIDTDHRELLTHVRARDPDAAMEVGRRHLAYLAEVNAR